MAKYLYALLAFLLITTTCPAQLGKIDTDRPDQTESVATVPPHYFQAEIGFNKENISGRDYDLVHPTALFKYGLKGFEFRLETTYKSSYTHLLPDPVWTRGFEPVAIGFKVALCKEKKILPTTSLIVHLAFPTIASEPFQADKLAPDFRFTLQHTITPNIGLGYNIGAEWDGFSKEPIWLYTFAPGFNLGEKWYGYVEAFGFIRQHEPAQHSLDGGIAYFISRDVKIDLSGGFGISDSAPDNYVAIGISFRCNTRKNRPAPAPRPGK